MALPVEAGVLGPLKTLVEAQDVTPTAQKQRQVLALLLVKDSQVVPLPTLMEELWADAPPRSAVTIIQTYVLGLRKHFAGVLGTRPAVVADELLQTRGRGYAFNTEACAFDMHCYLYMVKAAKQAVADHDDNRAVRFFTDAEEGWRGPALVDVECGLPLATEAARLDQIRLASLEMQVEAQLRLGRYRDVVIDLTALVLRHPFHEKLHAYLMLALSKSGMRSRALEVFHKLRHSMITELGIEPCWVIQQLHREIIEAASENMVVQLLNDITVPIAI
jgi:DNA-binding SARP family transcriptional activator